MGYFRYEVADKKGRILSGTMQAASSQDVAKRLQAQGYTIRGIGPTGGGTQSRPRLAAQAAPKQVRGRASHADLFFFFQQLASLLRSGINPHDSLTGLAQRVHNRALRKAAVDIANGTREGGSLSALMRRHLVFPSFATALIHTGEVSGTLPAACEELAAVFDGSTRYRRFFWFTRVSSWSGWLGIIFGVPAAPAFWKTFIEGRESSAAVLQGFGDYYIEGVVRFSIPVAVISFSAYYLLMWLLRTPWGQRITNRALLLVPMGPGTRTAAESMRVFLYALRNLHQTGVPGQTAWAMAAQAVPNAHYRARLVRAGSYLTPESSIDQAAAACGLFDHNAVALMQTGRQSGDMVRMLEQLRSMRESEFGRGEDMSKAFTCWGSCLIMFILTSALILLLAWGYFGGVFDAVDKFMEGG